MFIGDRVVVRYRLGPGAPGDWRGADGATLSDVTGVILDAGDPLILTRAAPAAVASDDRVRIPAELVSAVRLLPYRAVRNREIRDVALRAVEAVETGEIAGWRVRLGIPPDDPHPVSTAVPARLGARLDAATESALQQWFAPRGLPPIIELPERLVAGAAIGVAVGGEFHRLVRVAGDGTESTIVTVSADDVPRGTALRADGYALHHRVTYRQLGP
ncbi:hypothetical protein GCM10010528_06000 [Gordonia defluvii]|jgi:hypothetical protein|uniref:Histone acetyltransferase Rv0428c-like C-terminal domain-containing protein n=1 Tax=Gordonia defluvii TaxID=283718 RepID=A0ABP6L0F2_9ACTN|nr:hypothetical protein [Gordonia sp. UBA5067]